MSDAAQLAEPASELLDVARRVTAGWLERVIRQAARPQDASTWPGTAEVVVDTSSKLLARLEALLLTDVDEQRTNPLSLYRTSIHGATDLLRRHGVPVPTPDAFAAEHFPDDPYRLGPAAWSDIDPDLHTPGLTWGAWKAMTVLQRRREEGRR